MDEDPGDSQSDWEVGDEIVDYAWKSRDELLQQLPEPTCPDEASALLARFRPIRSTPQDLKRLLDARANPDINVGEGNICPLDKVMTFARTVHVPSMLHTPGPITPHACESTHMIHIHVLLHIVCKGVCLGLYV